MSRTVDSNSVRQQALRVGVSLHIWRKYVSGEPMRMKNARILAVKLGIKVSSINTNVRKSDGKKRYGLWDMERCRQWNKDNPIVPDWSEQCHIKLGH